MLKKDIRVIVENNLCMGCGACKIICPTKAISLQISTIGRLKAIINKDKCIKCGLCMEYCPGYDKKGLLIPQNADPFTGNVKNAYVGISNDNEIYLSAQSGGMVTELLSFLFDKKEIDAAIVCRSDFDYSNSLVKAIVVNSKEDLLTCQGSIYVPVDITSALDSIEGYNSVAVVGLPCHIQGLYTLQNKSKKINNIKYKLGLICDRTLSQALNTLLDPDANFKKCKFKYRDKKTGGYISAPIVVSYEDGTSKTIPSSKRHMLKNFLTSPRCRICFDKMNIHADIVFGDPWGISNIDSVNGESMLITRNEKLEGIIQQMIKEKRASLRIVSYEEVLQGQSIDSKRAAVSRYAEVYKINKWLLPSYIDKLALPIVPKTLMRSSRKDVDSFISLEHNSETVIINKIKINLFLFRVKNMLFRIIKRVICIFK